MRRGRSFHARASTSLGDCSEPSFLRVLARCHDARAHHDTNVHELGAKLGIDPVELVRGFNGRLRAHQVGSADLGQKIIDHMLPF
jgi:hypothetical protein